MDRQDWRLRDRWIWESPVRRLMAVAIPVLALLVGIPLYLFSLPQWPLVLLIICLGVVFEIVYAVVGKKVERLFRAYGADAAGVANCLIVNGIVQSPGIAVPREDRIELVPIVGESVVLEPNDIKGVRETHWFNGELFWSKTGFWLDIPGRKRLGFAVPSSTAPEWRARLSAPQR